MAKTYIIILTLLMSNYSFSQIPEWSWSKSEGNAGMENGSYITADKNGNIIAIGDFNSPFLVLGNDTVDNKGFFDAFIVKYDSMGNVLWGRSIGGNRNDSPIIVNTDNQNNIYIAGFFSGQQLEFNNDTLINSDSLSNDVFIVKYSSNGTYLWGESFGQSGDEMSYGLCTDQYNNVYVSGMFNSESLTFGNTTINNQGGDDMFVLKYDTDGNKIWIKGFGDIGNENVRGLSVDVNNDVIIIGEFDGPYTSIGGNVLYNQGDFDVFIIHLSPEGDILWAKSYGGNRDDKSISLSLDELGNTFVTGFFLSDTLAFESFVLNGGTPGNGEIWLVKLDQSGNVSWAIDNGGALFDKGIGVVNDGIGGAFLTGYFISESLTFGDYQIYNNGDETRDFYIAKYNSSGTPLWAYGSGGAYKDFGFSLCRFQNQIYATGKFESPNITFGETTLTNTSANQTSDMFVCKLSDAVSLGNTSEEFKDEIVVFPNPNNGIFKIQGQFSQEVLYEITNINGQLVSSGVLNNTLEIYGIPTGLYFIQLFFNNKNPIVKKIIVH